uniref:Tubulin/FtsZ GTPase domain-containing protein n=1 Tax=Guillardia theta TaxID=55529 RepID=A0A6U6CF00_GUITH|mmetsp:Transcript_45127/g.142078  ORF Transcript_45127/g.142078 Transcript_45127/m.142078 type:complete len:482 (+) Transcript_45127:237-1682(+)
MPRELITVQVGQCGNQIGCRFWDIALREHASVSSSKNPVFDESLSSFFRNVDRSQRNLPVGSPITSLRARAVLIDTETGVLNSIQSGPLRELFDSRQLISDQYGAGNNWAQGHMEYGPKYRESIAECVRQTVEHCDSLQSFFVLHSLGGGTGSGLGTYVLSLLSDYYPEVYRFTASVFPSEDDDVVTSPYNSALALKKLSDHADCVLPIENQALVDIHEKVSQRLEKYKQSSTSAKVKMGETGAITSGGTMGKARSFDEMNNIAANMLTNLTASMRFEGSLNVDLNEITMNMVPFPRLKFLVSSVSPLCGKLSRGADGSPYSVDAMFSEAFHKDSQLIKGDPKSSTYLACALMARGDVPISDMHRNVARMKKSVTMARWNPDGFKIGLCGTPPAGQDKALLCLSNNCCVADTFSAFQERFMRLYKRKAMLHHYDKFLGSDSQQEFEEAAENLKALVKEYQEYDMSSSQSIPAERMRIKPAI